MFCSSTYEVEVKVEAGYLRVRVAGTYGYRRSIKSIGAVRQHVRRQGLMRVLLDSRLLPQPISEVERSGARGAAVLKKQVFIIECRKRGRTGGHKTRHDLSA